MNRDESLLEGADELLNDADPDIEDHVEVQNIARSVVLCRPLVSDEVWDEIRSAATDGRAVSLPLPGLGQLKFRTYRMDVPPPHVRLCSELVNQAGRSSVSVCVYARPTTDTVIQAGSEKIKRAVELVVTTRGDADPVEADDLKIHLARAPIVRTAVLAYLYPNRPVREVVCAAWTRLEQIATTGVGTRSDVKRLDETLDVALR